MKQTLIGRLRKRIFTPDSSEVLFEKRGFPPAGGERQANLEKVGTIFLKGFGYGIAGSELADIVSALETIEWPFLGFAYEGCAMALAIRDSLRPARRHWISDFLAGPASRHIYMAHIGIGWAMARIPTVRWRAIMPRDDVLRWLALDGYGFHQAYFRTSAYVGGQYQAAIPFWEPADYASHAVDQGIGRALWFASGADAARIASTISRFAPERRGDLWSGAGLASVYAGGAPGADLKLMAELSGMHRPDAAQGAVFAASARLTAGLVTPHTETAVRAYCAMSVEEAAAVAEQAREVLADAPGPLPRYEMWRRRIRQQFE